MANDPADALSRKTAPKQTVWCRPSPLHYAKEVFAPLRDDLFIAHSKCRLVIAPFSATYIVLGIELFAYTGTLTQ